MLLSRRGRDTIRGKRVEFSPYGEPSKITKSIYPYVQARRLSCRRIFAFVLLASKTNYTFDVGHKVKRYIFSLKTGVVKPKGIFYASIAATITDKNAIIKVPISQTFQKSIIVCSSSVRRI